ncbi:MAG: cytochrome b/b6 domain-containing protein [Hyphomonadaceae bacterium]|nr:cytochrome b/b6 domain-containing protein [Hyphomonadaceae bacterium]
MALANTRESYGWIAIALHWIAAIGVLLMFYYGFQAAGAGDAGDRAARRLWMGLHISTGATLFLFFAARIIWAYAQPRPVKPPQARWLNILSSATQHLLLLALLIQIISGPLAVWSGGRAINVFDVVSLPSPFAAENEGVHEAAELAHLIGRIILFWLIPLHVLGALKHVVLDRDGAFRRMLYPSKLKT